MRSRLAAGIAVPLLLSAPGCGGEEITSNQVKILQVSPATAVPGVATPFVITASYQLVRSKPLGVISYCFAPRGLGLCILEDDERVVSSGSGQAQFTVVKTLDGPNDVTVFLADWPHPDSWDPLDRDYVVVSTSP